MQDEPYLLATLERSTRTGVHVAGLRIATYALVFISSILVARVLGPEGRGRYALPIAVLAIVLALGNLGLEHAQIYLAGKGVPLTTLWANSSLVGAGVAIVTWVLAAVLIAMPVGIPGDAIPTTWLLLALVQVPVLLHVLYWLNILQLAGHVRVGVAIGMVVATQQVASVGIVIRADALTPFAFLVIIGLMNLLTWAITLGMGVRLGLASRRIDRSALAEGLRFGLRAQLGIMFVFLLFRVDQILVERFLGFHELGLYTLAVTLAELLWLASDPFAASLLPHQVAAQGDDDVRLGYAAARLSLLMICAVTVISWIAAPAFIRLTYGPEFAGSVWPFRLLLPGVVALSIQRPLAGVLLKRGRVGLVSAFGALALVANLVANVLLLPAIGVVGASIGSSVAYIVLASAYVIATRRPSIAGPRQLVPGVADALLLRRALRSAVTR